VVDLEQSAACVAKGYADRWTEDRWSVVRCESQQADPRPRAAPLTGGRELDAVTAAPGGEAVVRKRPDDIAPVPSRESQVEPVADYCFDAIVS